MKAVDRHMLARKLETLRSQLIRLAAYRNLTTETVTQNPEKRYAAERLLELCIQSMVDISRMAVAGECWKDARTHHVPLRVLVEREIISPELVGRLLQAKAFRRLLMHEHAAIHPELLSENLRRCFSDLEEYHAKVSAWVARFGP